MLEWQAKAGLANKNGHLAKAKMSVFKKKKSVKICPTIICYDYFGLQFVGDRLFHKPVGGHSLALAAIFSLVLDHGARDVNGVRVNLSVRRNRFNFSTRNK